MSNYRYNEGGYRYLVIRLLDPRVPEFEVVKGFNEFDAAILFYLDLLKIEPFTDRYRILDTVENSWIFYKLITEPVEV